MELAGLRAHARRPGKSRRQLPPTHAAGETRRFGIFRSGQRLGRTRVAARRPPYRRCNAGTRPDEPGSAAARCGSKSRLKLVIQSGRESLDAAATPGRGARATVVGEYSVSSVVAVRRESSAAGAQIVMRIAVIDGQCCVEIPAQLLVEFVPPRNRVHVSRIAGAERVEVMFSAR